MNVIAVVGTKHEMLWPELPIYSHGIWLFDKFVIKYKKKQFMSSGDKPILALKISVTIFFRFRYFADFDIKIVLLG